MRNLNDIKIKWVVAALVLFSSLLAGAYTPPASNRTKFNFNYDWKFIKQDVAGAEASAINDASWDTVSCPHTFNDIDTFDDYMVGGHVGEANQWHGTTWYRKHFKLPPDAAGKRVFVEFEAVRQIADVYVNGIWLGKNSSGFTPFGYDLTPHLDFEASNVIAVKVNNERSEIYNDNNPIPWNHEHWHPTHGGIYRNVYLHTVDKLHVTLPLYDNLQTIGTYVYTSNVSAQSAGVTIEAEVHNGYATAQPVSFEAVIVDNDGTVLQSVSGSSVIEAGARFKFSESTTVLNPNLWHTRHPYLHKVYTIIRVGNSVKDVYETPLGIRSFDFDKDSGFWLNSEHVKLHGWGQKPTGGWAGLGAAVPDWLRDFTYRLMDEAGGNFIRWGHCAGSPAEIAMGDRYGFVTLMPGVCGEGDGEGAWDIRAAAFRDMIVYFRNHPSIFIWEGGNWAASASHFEDLTASINAFDPMGQRRLGNRRAEVKANAENYISIEVGTEGWDRQFPNLPIVESEYCRDESPRRVWDNDSLPSYGNYPRKNLNQYKWTSEQYAVLQAGHWWNKVGKKPYHAGGANWIFSDGTHGGRNPSEVVRASGEVDAVRLPKEAFYALKAMWRPEPQVHIVGHWTYEAGRQKDIFVMSNCTTVNLYVNGVLKGTNSTPENGYVFKFPNIAFAPGTIMAEGLIDGVLKASQQKETAGPKHRIKLTPITGPNGWRADGSDIALLDVEVVDSNGRRCPTNQQDISFTVSGPGVWRGGYNSNTPANTRALTLYTECGINRVSIRSTLTPGTVTITASGSGVMPDSVEITSQSVSIIDGLSTEMPQIYSDPLGPPEPPQPPPPGSVTDDSLAASLISFSTEQATNPAERAIDRDPATRWAAVASGFPQSIEVDLGSLHTIDRTALLPYQGRAFQYRIEVKTSAEEPYSIALDETANTTGGPELAKSFPAVPARHVKLTVTGAHLASWVSLHEFRIYGEPLLIESELFTSLSYTGPGQAIAQTNLQKGDTVYSDLAFTYANLPSYLIGAEFIQTPDIDKTYWAHDQLQFLAGKPLELHVAHDDRVPRPSFLANDYVDTGDDLLINGQSHSLFRRQVAIHTGVIMAGNFDSNPSQDSNMYVLFAKEDPNQALHANAGPNQVLYDRNADFNETVTLNGSGSSTAEGNITHYSWMLGASQIATGEDPSLTLPIGVHTLTLTVTNSMGESDSDSVVISIYGSIPGDAADASPLSTQAMGSTASDLSFYAGQFNNVSRSPVIVLKLPDLGEVSDPFTHSHLSFDLISIGGPPVGNVDLYGLGRRPSPTVVASDYWADTDTIDPTDATLLHDNLLMPTTPAGIITTTDLAGYLNTQYASGAGANEFVFLRLSSDADFGNSQRYFITSADGADAIFNESIRPKLNFIVVPLPIDSDLDGMPDHWELIHFGTLAETSDGDVDGDGTSNLAEYIAGTLPKDSTSRFGISEFAEESPGTGHFTLRWPGTSGRTYRVLRSAQLEATSWETISPPIEGTDGELDFTDTAPSTGDRQFYKIQVTLP